MVSLKAPFVLATALCTVAASPCSASTLSFDWGEATIVETSAQANLQLGDNSSVPPVSQTLPGGGDAKAEINIPLNTSNGNEFRILNQQRSNSDARLEYEGFWNDSPASNTVYTGSASISYRVTNSAAANNLFYSFRIEDTLLTLLSGGEESRSPFLLNQSGPTSSVGVQLTHLVVVNGVDTVSRKQLEFWTYNVPKGEFDSELRFGINQNGLSASTSPTVANFGDGETRTIGWNATVDQEHTIELGLFEQDETKDVLVQMSMRIIHGTEAEISAEYVDPASFSGRFSNIGSPSPVPLPAAAWLFLSALGGLGIIKRKRS